jgi:phosphatidylinositol alpha-mannosyltransferase
MQRNHTSTPKPRSLKIGLVLDDSLDRPDGVQQYVLTLGAWLQKCGHDVHYLVSATHRDDIVNVHSLARNVGVRFNGNRMRIPLPASPFYVHQFLKREQFDVLHVQMPYSPLLAGRVINAAGRKTAVVGTFHIVPQSWYVGAASRLLAGATLRSLLRFDAVASVSPAAQSFARQAFHIKSTVIPNTVCLDNFRDAEPLPVHDDKLNILFMGRLVQRKGCLLLLQATKLLKGDPTNPPFRVTVCGKGPLALELEKYVRDNGLERDVMFEGFVSETDKPRYFASADIAVFPSNGGESFGIVLVEAMASGKAAVLAGDNVGYRSVLDHCPGDVLFDAKNPGALAQKLRVLIADEAMRAHIAAWQQRHAENFDIAVIGPKTLKLYVSALRQRRNMR